ncbi:hypothetical protein HII36_26790 [Nonomuraea sp. NN258]|uniref:hypothetical protein n=1 Tax=Nonomuraea antri TaxID=2730852 RepID=UPI001568A1A7|nr:hypothetical protein [Nonomuraea antri]NRQ35409.1 hypothetical protein [Nonomuraea antri]
MRIANISLALATAGLALATTASPAPAVAAAAAPAAHGTVAAPTAMAKWYTQRHEAIGPRKGYFTTTDWKRLSGVRVMQVKARCWGNDSKIKVYLMYNRRFGQGSALAKSGTWSCNGQYGIVRIHNAGHGTYYAGFKLDKKHTVEYWVQYYK